MQRSGVAAAAFVIALFWVEPGLAASGGQITLLAGQTSGDYGTDSDTDRQSATVRFTYGDKTRLRLELDMLRVSSNLGVTGTPFGVVPTQGRQGPQGPGGSGGNGGAGASGPGGLGGNSVPAAQPEPSSPVPLGTEWATGPGDIRMTLSRQLAGGGAKLFRLDAELGAKLPTAEEQERLGTGEWDYRLGVAGQYRFWSMTAFGGLGWNSLGDPEWIELADVFDVYLGLESEPIAERVVVSGWLEGNEEVVAGTGSGSALGLGIRGTGKTAWRVQVSAGLSGSAEEFSILVGTSFGVSAPTIGSRRVG